MIHISNWSMEDCLATILVGFVDNSHGLKGIKIVNFEDGNTATFWFMQNSHMHNSLCKWLCKLGLQ